MSNQLVYQMEEKYEDYLSDESKYQGKADTISFPQNTDEVIEIVRQMRAAQTCITIQGGRSGIVGGGVPTGGHIMSLNHMNHILEWEEREDQTGRIKVEAGVTLMELNQEIGKRLKNNSYEWPVQPSETSATIGGILASGAMGMNACYYGDSKQYVENIGFVTADGNRHVFENQADLDFIIGSEGIYGTITEATLILLQKPESIWGISFFFSEESEAYDFCEKMKKLKAEETADGRIMAAEFMDRNSLDLIEKQKPFMGKIKGVPDIPESISAMVYLELAGTEAGIEEYAMGFMELAAECGSDPESAWAVTGDAEIERMRNFRHAAAETVNLYIEERKKTNPQIRKLGTDMEIPGEEFSVVIHRYKDDLQDKGLSYCMFGHIFQNHLHVNILPKNQEEYEMGRQMILHWARKISEVHGNVAVENGIGKVKTYLTEYRYTPQQKKTMENRKQKMDPEKIWNPGNIFQKV